MSKLTNSLFKPRVTTWVYNEHQGIGNVGTEVMERLSTSVNIISGSKEEECEVTVVFCPIVSRAGTDIEAALCHISDDKPTIMVALHHTFDPDFTAPNSSKYNRNNLMLVDILFHEDSGLLKCQRNNTAISEAGKFLEKYGRSQRDVDFLTILRTVARWITNIWDIYLKPKPTVTIKIYFEHHPKIKNIDVKITDRLSEWVKIISVSNEEECEVKVVFCPIVSRSGTDIEAVLHRISYDKPTIMVALHHTFDPESKQPDSSSYKRNNVMLVDILFHEDMGLLDCSKNKEAISKAGNYLLRYARPQCHVRTLAVRLGVGVILYKLFKNQWVRRTVPEILFRICCHYIGHCYNSYNPYLPL